MLTLEQQTQVEDLIIGLEISDHPIEQVLTSAKDFLDPSKDIIELYIQVYSTYPESTLREIHNYVNNLISIRNIVAEGLEDLGFFFDFNELYEWLRNFYLFLDEFSNIHHMHINDEEDINDTKETLSEETVSQLVDNCHWRIGIEMTQNKLVKGVDNFILDLRKHAADKDSDLDIDSVINNINTLFESCWVKDFSDRDEVRIQTEPCFNTPYISERANFAVQFWNTTTSIHINPKLNILFKLVEYLYNRKSIWEKVEILRPSSEMVKQISEDKKIYGAKWAYLRFLKAYIAFQEIVIEESNNTKLVASILWVKSLLNEEDDINLDNAAELEDKIRDSINIEQTSPFKINLLPSIEVNIDLYKGWKAGENIDNELEELYTRATTELFKEPEKPKNRLEGLFDNKWLPGELNWLIVRSSAVNSEDNEKTSGAWIYESIGDIHSLEDFKSAVKKVFESVDSDKAKKHRRDFEIEEEFMGLVIMPYMEIPSEYTWYVNTSRYAKPHLLDVKDMSGKHAVLQKDLMMADLDEEAHFGNFISQMYNVDTWSSEVGFKLSDTWLAKALSIMYYMEYYFGIPMQFEVISESWHRSERIYIVQMRPLCYNDSDAQIPEFPKQEHIYEWKAVVPWDIIVDTSEILSTNSSWQATLNQAVFSAGSAPINHIENGEYNAVIITDSFSVNSWHIETLCSEKGIICICNDPSRENDMELDLSQHEKVRIVSDGEIARVYPVKN